MSGMQIDKNSAVEMQSLPALSRGDSKDDNSKTEVTAKLAKENFSEKLISGGSQKKISSSNFSYVKAAWNNVSTFFSNLFKGNVENKKPEMIEMKPLNSRPKVMPETRTSSGKLAEVTEFLKGVEAELEQSPGYQRNKAEIEESQAKLKKMEGEYRKKLETKIGDARETLLGELQLNPTPEGKKAAADKFLKKFESILNNRDKNQVGELRKQLRADLLQILHTIVDPKDRKILEDMLGEIRQ